MRVQLKQVDFDGQFFIEGFAFIKQDWQPADDNTFTCLRLASKETVYLDGDLLVQVVNKRAV